MHKFLLDLFDCNQALVSRGCVGWPAASSVRFFLWDHLAGLSHCRSLALVTFPLASQIRLLSSPWLLPIHPLELVISFPVISFGEKLSKGLTAAYLPWATSGPQKIHAFVSPHVKIHLASTQILPFDFWQILHSSLTFPDMSHNFNL